MTFSPTAPVQIQALAQRKPEGLDLYLRFALAGAVGCSVTHGAFTPVDVYVVPSASVSTSASASASLSLTDFPTASRPKSSLTQPPITEVQSAVSARSSKIRVSVPF